MNESANDLNAHKKETKIIEVIGSKGQLKDALKQSAQRKADQAAGVGEPRGLPNFYHSTEDYFSMNANVEVDE